jgi:(p)ppGpp synthase/HD superfamily hydrolase
MSTALTQRFDDALLLASRLHRQQRRKGSEAPYIAHLLGVCAIVLENAGDEDQAIAALLHDAVEDQGGRPTLDLIRQRFGDRVAHIVEQCSDSDSVDPNEKLDWQTRKETYIAHLPQLSDETRLVSLADKLYNARAILTDYVREGESVWERFKGKRVGTLWYYQALRDHFIKADDSDLSRQFARVVQELLSEANALPE